MAAKKVNKMKECNLTKHAMSEFVAAGWCDADGNFECDMQKLMCENVLDLLSVFSEQGHSGSSAPYAIYLFQKLASFSAIAPLTGVDSEWMDVGGDYYQNKRDGTVFKKGVDGKAYWLDFYVFEKENGGRFTSSMSRQFIEFPWVKPDSVIVKVSVDKDGNTIYPDYIKAISI